MFYINYYVTTIRDPSGIEWPASFMPLLEFFMKVGTGGYILRDS